jgi:hypothetical protein
MRGVVQRVLANARRESKREVNSSLKTRVSRRYAFSLDPRVPFCVPLVTASVVSRENQTFQFLRSLARSEVAKFDITIDTLSFPTFSRGIFHTFIGRRDESPRRVRNRANCTIGGEFFNRTPATSACRRKSVYRCCGKARSIAAIVPTDSRVERAYISVGLCVTQRPRRQREGEKRGEKGEKGEEGEAS